MDQALRQRFQLSELRDAVYGLLLFLGRSFAEFLSALDEHQIACLFRPALRALRGADFIPDFGSDLIPDFVQERRCLHVPPGSHVPTPNRRTRWIYGSL